MQESYSDTKVILKNTYKNAKKNHLRMLAAAFSFYMLFSIGATLIVILTIAGLVFPPEQIQAELQDMFEDIMGPQAAAIILSPVNNYQLVSDHPVFAIIGILFLIYIALRVVNHLQRSLDIIWEVRQKTALKHTIAKRIKDFVFVILLGVFIIAVLIAQSMVAFFSEWIQANVPLPPMLLEYPLAYLSLLVVAAVFALMYKVLPQKNINLTPLLVGSLLTATLYKAGEILFILYLKFVGLGSSYGASASLIVFLIWVYYSAQLILLGAQFTKEYSQFYERKDLAFFAWVAKEFRLLFSR